MNKFYCISLIIICCVLTSCAKSPKPIYPIPSAQQLEWQKMETYAFVHFGLNTFNDMEWGYGETPASTFNPTDLDCDQWAATLKQCGMKGIILTAKHHDGFCLWPTATTDYNISNSPYKNGKGDMVRELSDACKKYGLKFGLYLSPWDRNNAEYGREAYRELYHAQIHELVSNYGPLFEFWFDGANGGNGYYGGTHETRSIDARSYYQYERARDTILKYHPQAMIFGGNVPTIRWIGNEQGWAGACNWSKLTVGADNDNLLPYGDEEGKNWIPGEVDVSIRPGWFYHSREDHQVKSLAKLIDIYYNSVGHNANLLLNFPVGLSGKIYPQDSLRAMEWYKTLQCELDNDLLKNASVRADNVRGCAYKASNVNDGNWDSYWATSDDYDGGVLSFSFDKPVCINRVMLQEYIPLGQRVKQFYLEGELDNRWFKITPYDSTTTIGYKRIVRFNTVKLNKLIIYFEESINPICINNVEAFCAPILLAPPQIHRNAADEVFLTASDRDAKIFYTLDGSEPDSSSILYRKPFILRGKGTLKVVAYDVYNQKYSEVATRDFFLSVSDFQLVDTLLSGAMKAFDGNAFTVLNLETKHHDKARIALKLNKKTRVSGFKYLPNQSRDASQHIVNYALFIDGKEVAIGEFSNIKANPIEQNIRFQPVEGSGVEFVALSSTDASGRCGVAEFELITE